METPPARRHVRAMLMLVQETVENEIQPDNYQHRRKQPFAPLAEPAAYRLHAAAAAEHGYQRDAKRRISQNAAYRISQTVHEHTAAVMRVLGQIAHRRHVGGKRTRMQGDYKPKQKSRKHGNAVIVNQTLYKLHLTLKKHITPLKKAVCRTNIATTRP